MGTKKSNKLYAAAAALAVTASAVAPGLTADAATKVTVKSVTNPASISHYGGYTFAVKKLSLPKTVKVLLSNKKYENRSVKWGKVSYDKKYIGKYQTISGTVSGTTKKASIKVKLNNYPVDVVEPKLAPVAVGEKLNLPSTIDVKYKDGKVIARSAKSFNLTAEKTDKAGMMKLSYNYMGKNSSIKGSIAYEVKAAEITNVMDEVKDDMLSVSADVKYAAKDAKVEVLVYPGKDASKAMPFAAELKDGKLTAKTPALPAGSHSYVVKVGDVLSTPKDFSVEELKATVKAASSKTLEVSFNKVIDSTKAVVELKKDGFKVNAANITPSADKKSLIVELTSKITKGEYALNVSGLSDKALEASVKTEDEKVAGIDILSDIAPLTGAAGEATVGYKVVNQYGEDVTKLYGTSLVASVAGGSATLKADGTIALNVTGLKKDDKVVVTLIHPQTATTTTKTVTASSVSMAADVEFGTIYNKDGKVLSENSELAKDKFYLPVNVKDQYGNSITDLDRLNGKAAVTDKDGKEVSKAVVAEVILTNTNTGVAKFGKFEKQTINGKEVVVLAVDEVVAAGETNVIVIAKANGKNAQTTVKVAEGVRADAVSIGAPSSIVTANKEILFPLSVLDKQGKAVTDIKVIESANGVKVSGGKIIVKDGALFIQVAAESVIKDSPLTVVVTSSTNKVATQTVIPKEASKARVITGLKAGVSTAIRSGDTVTLKKTDFIVEDQYGQVLSDAELDKLSITAVSDEATAITADGLTLAAAKPAEKVAANITFKLDDKAESAFTKKFTVVKNTDFASYKVADLAPIYIKDKAIPADYERDIVVKAVTASGNEVKLKAGANEDYTVKSTLLTDVADSKINADDASKVEIASNETTAKAKVTVTINATGEEFVKEVTFSNVAPKVEKVDVVAQNEAAKFMAGDALKAFTAAEYAKVNAFDLDEFFLLSDVVVTDQYGVQAKVTETGADEGTVTLAGVKSGTSTLTFTKATGDVVFTSNGTTGAEATGKANDAFNVRYNLNGNAGSTIKVTATKDFSAQ